VRPPWRSPACPRPDYDAAKKAIAADYKAAKTRCEPLAGNAKDICAAEAKGKEKVALAELGAAYKPTSKTHYDARVAKAEADYSVAKEKCDDQAGNARDVCVKEAQALQTAAKADAKASMKTADAKQAAASRSPKRARTPPPTSATRSMRGEGEVRRTRGHRQGRLHGEREIALRQVVRPEPARARAGRMRTPAHRRSPARRLPCVERHKEHHQPQHRRRSMTSFKRVFTLLAALAIATTLGCAGTAKSESTGEYFDDVALTAKVKSDILAEPTLKSAEINVETFKGVVQLSGFVSTQANIDKAVVVAKNVKGVASVSNKMSVK
jgi:hypothetical protein